MHRAVFHQLRLGGPAGHQHHVGVRDLRQRGIASSARRPGVGPLRPRLLRDERQLGAGQPAEDLVGPHGVERGESVVDEDGDLHWCSSMSGRRFGRGGSV